MEQELNRNPKLRSKYKLLLDEASKDLVDESKVKKMMEELGLVYSRDPFERANEILKRLK